LTASDKRRATDHVESLQNK